MGDFDKIKQIIMIILGIIVLFLIYKLFVKLGVIGGLSTSEEEAIDKNVSKASDPENYSKVNVKKVTFTKLPFTGSESQNMVNQIHKALVPVGDVLNPFGLGTDLELLYGTIKQINTKYRLSQVSSMWKATYNDDMMTDILGDLNGSEKVKLNNLIKSMPER